MTMQEAAERYKDYLETLSPESLSRLSDYVTADVRFADPFNDVRGRDRMLRIFADMFESVSDIEFNVVRMAVTGDTALMAWTFDGAFRGRSFTLEGMSRVTFSPDGLVTAHVDHWDSATQFYMRLPVIGSLLSFVRRRVASH